MRLLWADAGAADVPRAIDARRGLHLTDLLSALFAAAALAAFALPVAIEQATEGTPSTRASDPSSTSVAGTSGPELTFAGYGGVPYTYPSDVVFKKNGLHDFTVHDVAWDGKPFNNPIYYGARFVGYGGGRFGAMLDFTHSKALARLDEDKTFTGTLNGAPAPERATLRDIFKKLEASHGHNMLTLNGLLRLPAFGLKLQPYVGLGAGVTLPHAEIGFAAAEKRTYEYQMAGPVGQAVFGIEIRTARMTYFLEYKFTLAPYTMPLSEREGSWLPLDLWNQYKDWMSGEEPPGGVAKTTYISHQGIFGLGVRLLPRPVAP
jgi:lipid A oxidase